jgi:tetratricopeptide (TPR) repeat protein
MNLRFAITCFLLFIFSQLSFAQTQPNTDAIRKQMAKIRQTTNWNDPVAAKKANEDIKKLAQQLSGGKPTINFSTNAPAPKPDALNFQATAASEEMVVKIADRFFQRSYKQLNSIAKNQFDTEFKNAEKGNFNAVSVQKLTSTGAFVLQFSEDPNLACTFLASAVKISPQDTLSINNFGAYLRMIDSTKTALSVHLYANSLFSQSPVILTQIGCSYYELKDFRKAEDYLKEALKFNSNFGQAHSALCDLYLQTGRWKDALHQLFAAVVGDGISYGRAHSNLATIKNAAQSSPSVSAGKISNAINQNSSGDKVTKGDFWGENNLGINPEDMLASLDPEANIPDNEKLAPLVPRDNRLKMPDFQLSLKLVDWTHGGGYNESVKGYQIFMSTLLAFNTEFQQVHQSPPSISPNAILRDYPNERFAIECILEYFSHQSEKEYEAYSEKVDGLPEKAGLFIEDYFKKHDSYLREWNNCLDASRQSYVNCMGQCEGYPGGSSAREICERNCDEKRKHADNECTRLFCLHDCNAANECNFNMEGIFAQYQQAFADHKKKQEELLNDLYAFTDKWLARIHSSYWSKIYAYEINREAFGIIGQVYTAYQQPFQATVTSNCGSNCSDYVIQPPAPIAKVIPKELLGNECPLKGNKLSLGIGFCGVDFDCESIEAGCSAGVSMSVKRTFLGKKATTLFVGGGGEVNLGVASAELKTGLTFTQYDNGDLDVGGKYEMSGTVKGVGKNVEMSATLMEGAKDIENNNLLKLSL